MNAPSARQLAELERTVATLRAVDAKASSAAYIPHKPSIKQAEFLAVQTEEALYGGAAGGGKSDALLMAALEHVHVPGYAALILRRTYQDLARSDAIMARADEWLRGTNARWRAETRTWHFPSGATLSFGYFDTQADRRNYQGGAWQFIAFDELTQFPEAWYLYLFSRLRKTHQPVPLRMRAATNPGDIGHEWVFKRFIEPGDKSRPFVPARLDDNPHLDRDAYRRQLSKLDEVTRRQLEDGAWIQDTSGLVYHYDEGRNAIAAPPECKPANKHRVLALDFGVVDPTSFTILEWHDHDATVYVTRSWKVPGMSPGEAAEEINRLEAEYSFEGIVGDVGGLGKAFQAEVSRRFHVPIEPAEKANKLGYISLMNGDLEKGRIKVVRGACESLVKEWKQLPWHESRTKEHPGFDNHCADGALYGWRKCMAFVERPREKPPTREEIAAREEEALEDAVEAAARRDDEWLGAL